MALFSKKDTLIRSMPLMGLMAAINIIFSLFTSFIPLLAAGLVIFIPLTSAVVEISCKDRYFPIYALATLGLSICVSLQAIDFTIFYLVPSIITGYIFGFMSKKNFPDVWGILFATIAQTVVSFAFVPLIQLITERNLIEDIRKLLGAGDSPYFNNCIILLFFVIALIQIILSFIVVDNELKKFGVKNEEKRDWRLPVALSTISSCLLVVIFYFVYIPISIVCAGIAWYFLVFCVIFEFKIRQKVSLIIMSVLLFANIFLFALLNKYFPKGTEMVLSASAPFCISIVSLIFYFLKKQK